MRGNIHIYKIQKGLDRVNFGMFSQEESLKQGDITTEQGQSLKMTYVLQQDGEIRFWRMVKAGSLEMLKVR